MDEKYVHVLNDIQEAASFHQIVLNSIDVAERKIIRGALTYKGVSFQLNIHSDYDAIKSFVGSLEALPALLYIKSMETIRNEEILPRVETTMHLKVFVL